MTARFEIVHTHSGWHARYRAVNGRIIWWTETYRRHASALRAVELLATQIVIREVDER